MIQWWWVNHNQTARQEIDGQYLWSPKTERNGARSEFYRNMRRASPGDLVLSYSGQMVRYVGRVTDFAITAPKPEEFGTTGLNWSQEGWLLPVYWTSLTRPVSPRSILERLRRHLPTRHSPISAATGYGNQKAYLANIPQEAFETVISASDYDRDVLLHGGANSLTFEAVSEALDDIVERRIAQDLSLDQTTRESVILARRGQGQFRANVEAIGPSCLLTGVTNPALLIASHIKPWRACSTAHERLDGMNGLMLTPDADCLFDRGFISFDDRGDVLVSERVAAGDLRRLGLGWIVEPEDRAQPYSFGFSEAPAAAFRTPFASSRRVYLKYHREEVFIT